MVEPVPPGPADEPAPSQGRPAPGAGGRSLVAAVATALVLLALAGSFALAGIFAFFILVCIVVLTALFELFDAVTRSGRRPVTPYGLACALALLAGAYLGDVTVLVVALGLTVFGSCLLALRPGRGETPASDLAWTVLGVAWIGGGGAAA